MLYEYTKVEEIDEDSGGADENMRKERRVNLSQIAREKTIL